MVKDKKAYGIQEHHFTSRWLFCRAETLPCPRVARCNCKYQIANIKLKICHTVQLFILPVLTFAFCTLHFLQMTLITRISTDKNSSQNRADRIQELFYHPKSRTKKWRFRLSLFSPIYFLLPTLYYLLMFEGNRQRWSLHNALRCKKIRFNAGGI